MRALIAGLLVGFVATAFASEKAPESFQKTMKELGAVSQSLRGHVQAKDNDAIAADAAKIKEAMNAALSFWKDRKVEDATNFATTGVKAATDLEAAAKAKNDDGVAAAARALNGTCMGCHAAHREKVGEGYEIK
jgi:cytochrome c556